MKNYYSTVDNVVMTFSDIEERNGFDEITVYFERANDKGEFDFTRSIYVFADEDDIDKEIDRLANSQRQIN